MKRNALVFATLLIAILAMLAAGKWIDRRRHHGAVGLVGNVQGAKAPDFELPSLDGRKVKLSDYRGKAVLLNFWATWCPPCKIEMPWFVELQKQYGKDGLVVIGVAMDDSEPQKISEFAHEMGLNYPVLLGTDQVSDDYGNVQYLPTTFYIDRDGKIINKAAGLFDRQQIEDDVKKALASNHDNSAVQPSQTAAQVPVSSAKGAAQ